MAKSRCMVSIGRTIPKQINCVQKRDCATCGVKPHPASFGLLLDHTGFMEASGVFRGSGNLDSALGGNFFHAQIAFGLQNPDHFNSAVICQSGHQFCPSAIMICHSARTLAYFHFLPKVKIWGREWNLCCVLDSFKSFFAVWGGVEVTRLEWVEVIWCAKRHRSIPPTIALQRNTLATVLEGVVLWNDCWLPGRRQPPDSSVAHSKQRGAF